jgi:predicted metal-dependent phosphotriesterase family hydrolase
MQSIHSLWQGFLEIVYDHKRIFDFWWEILIQVSIWENDDYWRKQEIHSQRSSQQSDWQFDLTVNEIASFRLENTIVDAKTQNITRNLIAMRSVPQNQK